MHRERLARAICLYAIENVIEGGKQAFELPRQKYGF